MRFSVLEANPAGPIGSWRIPLIVIFTVLLAAFFTASTATAAS